MAIETEIKLRTTLKGLQALRQSPILINLQQNAQWQKKALYNSYFDTPEHALANSAVALRIRRDGEQLIQTLKSRGNSIAGLSARNEWDWNLTSDQLDLNLLDENCWPSELAELDKTQLQPIFTTDFTRELIELSWDYQGQPVTVEVALDQGQVQTEKGSEEICELELELRQGPVAALFDLALKLAAEVPLMPCDISKAERGYRLYDNANYRVQLAAPALTEDMSLDQAIPELVSYLLGNSQRLAEQYRFNQHWKLLEQWFVQLTQLKALLGSLGLAAPRKTTAELRQQLDVIISDWQPIITQGGQDQALREQATEQFTQGLLQHRWGLFSLSQAAWLEQSAWQQQRNAKGQRQGQALLVNWLSHFFKDELLALQVETYLSEPQRISEQSPRLERLVVWLELSRDNLTDVVGADSLLGVLRQLLVLSQAELEAELAAELVERLIELRRLTAWKALTR